MAPTRRIGTVPEVPIGAKFELTHRCNLLCAFCYTDSPAKTLRRDPELTNQEWLAVIDQAIELGIVEAVLTGGEPLLRKRLTLEAANRLGGAGVGVILNTNGWFVDDACARALSAIPNLKVAVSIDAASAPVHDAGRGVPGSWLRAVEAADRLLAHGADVRVNYVVTPTNQHQLAVFVDAMVDFGVPSLRVAAAGLGIGGTARGGDWTVDAHALDVVWAQLKAKYPSTALRFVPQGTGSVTDAAPEVFLVRPDGAVVLDSGRPLRFGTVPAELAQSWELIRSFWQTEGPAGLQRRLEGSVAYRDDDVPMPSNPTNATAESRTEQPPRPAPTPVTITRTTDRPARVIPTEVPVTDQQMDRIAVVEGTTLLAAMADARTYRTAALRWSGDRLGDRMIRTVAGRKHTVDRRAGALLDAFATGTSRMEGIRAAVAACRVPEAELRVVFRQLVERKLLVPLPTTLFRETGEPDAADIHNRVRMSYDRDPVGVAV